MAAYLWYLYRTCSWRCWHLELVGPWICRMRFSSTSSLQIANHLQDFPKSSRQPLWRSKHLAASPGNLSVSQNHLTGFDARRHAHTHTHCQEFDKGMLLHVTTCYIMLHHHIITKNNGSKCVSSALLCWLLAMFPYAAMLGLLRCWDAEAERPSGEGRALALQCAPKMPGPGNPLVPHLVMSSSTL